MRSENDSEEAFKKEPYEACLVEMRLTKERTLAVARGGSASVDCEFAYDRRSEAISEKLGRGLSTEHA
jgi:hypothetical protein